MPSCIRLGWQLTTTSAQEKDAVDRSVQSEEPPLAGEGEGAAGSGEGDGCGEGDAGEASAGCWAERQMPQEVWHWVLQDKAQGGAVVRNPARRLDCALKPRLSQPIKAGIPAQYEQHLV